MWPEYAFGIKPKKADRNNFFKYLLDADMVANLLGISFCSNFDKGRYSFFNAAKSAVGTFPLNFIAKLYKIRSIKCTGSYGPIISKIDNKAAIISVKYLFDLMYARENESRKELERVTGISYPVSPDLANLMPFEKSITNNKVIGISISYQIIRQWKAGESYIDCIVELIKHILSCTDYDVELIPNEITSCNKYNDIHVADDIYNKLVVNERVSILNIREMTSTQLKNSIAKCEVLIASRYHSCVAALSAGIPVLVVGWHYKYDELLDWYGQNKWIISSENCNKEKLIALFDEFWLKREDNKVLIKDNYSKVREALFAAGKEMFSVSK